MSANFKLCCALALASSLSAVDAFAPAKPENGVRMPFLDPPVVDGIESEASSALLGSDNEENNNHRRLRRMQRPVLQVSRVEAKKHWKRKVGLTVKEEQQYSFQIRKMRTAIRLRDQLVRHENDIYIHPTEAEWAAACGSTVADLKRILEDGQEARTAMVAANTGLVTSQAKRHWSALKHATEVDRGVGTILTLQDMIQEGNLGLMEAAERFEPERGLRFSTYAVWWVRQRILRAISDSSRTIRLPAHVHSTLQKMRRAAVDIKQQTGKEASLKELSLYMELPEEKLRKYTESSRNVVSLEVPLRTESFKEDRRTLGDTLQSDAPTPMDLTETDSLRTDIRAVMNDLLGATEQDVITNRFGLDDHKPRTVAETAERLGLSRDRVRLVEARALNKLRHPAQTYRLKDYADVVLENEEEIVSSETYASSTGADRIWLF